MEFVLESRVTGDIGHDESAAEQPADAPHLRQCFAAQAAILSGEELDTAH